MMKQQENEVIKKTIKASPEKTNEVEKTSNESMAIVAKRPSKGKVGTKLKIISNSYSIRTPLDQIHLYSVEFTPDLPEDAADQRLSAVNHKSIRDKIIANYGMYFFAHKNLLCLRKIEGENQYTNEDLTQTITIKYTKSIDLKDLTPERIEQHELVIHKMLSKVIRGANLHRIGSSYFERNEALFSGKGKFDICMQGVEAIRIWRGYDITCEQKMNGMYMTMGIRHRIIWHKSVADDISGTLERFHNNPKAAQRKLEEQLVGCNVITIHNKRMYRVESIDWEKSIDDEFQKDGGKMISYRNYFKETYGEEIKQSFKGMLVHRPRRRKNKKGPEEIFLPPELCHCTGLTSRMKSNFQFMKRIAQTTSIPPKQSSGMLNEVAKRLQKTIGVENYDTDSMEGSQKGKGTLEASSSPAREEVNARGVINSESQIPMILGQKPVQLQGRLLPKFKVSVASEDNTVLEVDPYHELQNSWNNAKFINKVIYKLRKWVVIGEDQRLIEMCIKQIINVARNGSLLDSYISAKPMRKVVPMSNNRYRNNINNWKNVLEKTIEEEKPNLVLCLLPDDRTGNPTAVYNLVKEICCTKFPVLSQCISKRNVMKNKRSVSVFKGLVKQMLTKIGNTPWRANLSLPDKTIDLTSATMVCGMDVNHDPRRNTSTVTFVASYSPDYTKYNNFVYHQSSGREVMIECGKVMGDALKKFHAINKLLPKNIIVYRDGVSTSQLSKIALHEVRSFKERFSKIKVEGRPYSPKLVVVVTQKNVNARFTDERFSTLQPGTVIDSDVTSAKFWDFYLISCSATNRTAMAAPTRYIVVHDSMNVSPDDIATLTNAFCNLYFNRPGPVRVPGPIQNAHKCSKLVGSSIANKKICDELTSKLASN